MEEGKPHSAAVLNELREYWWSPDFMQLMSRRWKLSQVKNVLDVGCGHGHWGQLLLGFMSKETVLEGIDPEPKWITESQARAHAKQTVDRSHYSVASVEQIPFQDNSFDMVTCQTVLIHVKEPFLAIQEMYRVLKPGGIMVVAEPNNLVTQLVFNNLTFDEDVDSTLARVKFQLICERGREKLGRGNIFRGDIIPKYFNKSHLNDIQVYLSDMADSFVPPYQTPRENLTIQFMQEAEQGLNDARAEYKEIYLAGGGNEADFSAAWDSIIKHHHQVLHAMNQNNFVTSGGLMMYLISGRK